MLKFKERKICGDFLKFILDKRSLHNRYRMNKKIQYSMLIILIIAITCIGANINRNLVKQKNVKESIVEKNAMTPMSSIKSEEQQHNYYFKGMKKKK